MGLILASWPVQAVTFTLVTYNMAQFSDQSPQRISTLLTSIVEASPEVVYLQETTIATVSQLNSLAKLYNAYDVRYQPDSRGNPKGGLMFLVKKTWRVGPSKFTPLPSEMARGVLSLKLSLCEISHQLINVHLESSDFLFWRSRPFRIQQANKIKLMFDAQNSVVLAGDFNIDNNQDADQSLPSNWIDLWPMLKHNDPGLTWDPKTNSLAWKYGGFISSGGRLDRIFYASEVLHPIKIERLGTQRNPPLSDHYGVMATFSMNCN